MFIVAAAVLAAFSASPAKALDREALRPPVADEAHGLKGAERDAALAVLRAHYGNLLDAYGPLRLSGVDWKDPSRPASCEIRLALPQTGYPGGAFVEGLPVRKAQPLVFNQIQIQLTGAVSRCSSDAGMAFTSRTWSELEESARGLVQKNAAATYCLKDSDCIGVEIHDPCGRSPDVRVFGSNTTDAVFFVGYRMFLRGFMKMAEEQVTAARVALKDRHPDGKNPDPARAERCLMRHWEERPVPAVCSEHACRAKTGE